MNDQTSINPLNWTSSGGTYLADLTFTKWFESFATFDGRAIHLYSPYACESETFCSWQPLVPSKFFCVLSRDDPNAVYQLDTHSMHLCPPATASADELSLASPFFGQGTSVMARALSSESKAWPLFLFKYGGTTFRPSDGLFLVGKTRESCFSRKLCTKLCFLPATYSTLGYGTCSARAEISGTEDEMYKPSSQPRTH